MKTIFPPLHSRAGQRLVALAAVAFIILLIVLQYGVYGLLVTSFFVGAVGSFFGGGDVNKNLKTPVSGPKPWSSRETELDPLFKMYKQNIWHRSN
ncbi:MAG: hypothetical protein IPK64_21975 [bacterium]|nr:hypothetical protein [bacterium]